MTAKARMGTSATTTRVTRCERIVRGCAPRMRTGCRSMIAAIAGCRSCWRARVGKTFLRSPLGAGQGVGADGEHGRSDQQRRRKSPAVAGERADEQRAEDLPEAEGGGDRGHEPGGVGAAGF